MNMIAVCALVVAVAVLCYLLATYVLPPSLVRPVNGAIVVLLVVYLIVCVWRGVIWPPGIHRP